MTASQSGKTTVGYQTRALTRALMILDSFGGSDETLTVAGLHRSLGLPKSTIIRLAGELEQHGYLRQRNGGYELGAKTLELGALYLRRHGVLDIVRPILEELRNEVGETVCLATLADGDVLHLDVIVSHKPIHFRTDVGSRAPAHSTALGKAILATLDNDAIRATVGPDPYRALTANTRTSWPDLIVDIERTRERGYSLDVEESAIGLKCVGVATDASVLGPIALSVSSTPEAIDDEMTRSLAAALRRAADQIVRALERTSPDGAH